MPVHNNKWKELNNKNPCLILTWLRYQNIINCYEIVIQYQIRLDNKELENIQNVFSN